MNSGTIVTEGWSNEYRVRIKTTGEEGWASSPHSTGWVTIRWDSGHITEDWAPLTAGWLVVV